MNLTEEILYEIKGGAKKSWQYAIFLGIGGLIVLITGIIDGYMNPQKCNS